MGIKKITPEERLLNLIKKTNSSPIQEKNPAPMLPISEVQVLPSMVPVRKKNSYFRSVFFFALLLSGLIFWSVQKNLFSFKNFPSFAKIKTSAMEIKPENKIEPLAKTSEIESPAIKDRPSLMRIPPPNGYILTGVIIGEPLSAIIRNAQTEEMLTLEIGDSLLQYTLTRIEKGKVTFEDSQNTFTLTL